MREVWSEKENFSFDFEEKKVDGIGTNDKKSIGNPTFLGGGAFCQIVIFFIHQA